MLVCAEQAADVDDDLSNCALFVCCRSQAQQSQSAHSVANTESEHFFACCCCFRRRRRRRLADVVAQQQVSCARCLGVRKFAQVCAFSFSLFLSLNLFLCLQTTSCFFSLLFLSFSFAHTHTVSSCRRSFAFYSPTKLFIHHKLESRQQATHSITGGSCKNKCFTASETVAVAACCVCGE